ncbi:tryptophan--tRNA ligase, chloroplastic/mitochondrial-like isoform X2 [Zingiber officinale]|uniref:tryptophan--tRNA ligase, chloroplastic/mitochondrial-like isoform X2 n=1 Tax=Zingiber officinale TaxID=94328 RepID=UPI001C4D580C|nr:tryptophan--tRNA ligase, chloroplastic/mitochondrial-like isoform X2 [Zingiber officinale]
MSRALLSQFLNVSFASPRLSASIIDRGQYLRRVGIPSRAVVADFSCDCSASASAPAPATEAPGLSPSPSKKRVVSGVQPTGSVHLGNYLGAIKNWVLLQDTYDTFFFIVDLHAITLPYDASELSKATRSTAALYLACGIDPSKASVFLQSHVRAHVELMWLLSSVTPLGWLNRMIQFKEKSRMAGDENVGVALLTYPVLMASDILLYQTDLVPVGEDQKQHLELTRELAERVNYLYGGRKWKKLGGFLKPLFHQQGLGLCHSQMVFQRCRSLRLLISLASIFLTQKMMEFDNPERPECNNLLSIYQLVTGKTKEEVENECQNMNWGTFKAILTDAVVDHLHPIQVRYSEITTDPTYLDHILSEGAKKAADIAEITLSNVYQAMGFLKR